MKKHNFVRQDFHKKRLRKRWVKPRGLHSKIRLKHKGHARKVSNGYGSPRKLRGLSKEGLIVVLIHNEDGLNKVDKEKQGVIISRTVGTKNKILMLKKAKEKGIKILNIKVDDYLKKKEKESEDKLKKKKVQEEKKKEKEEKKAVKKEGQLEEKLGDDEKKDKAKKEKDKMLTKREA